MRTKILSMLRQSEGYVSGQQMCDALHISRTAVWKNINQLKEEGYKIEAQNKLGYKLTECPDILSRHELESRLSEGVMGRKVVYYEETDSTNIAARQLDEHDGLHGTLVVAERQTAGKGRRGHSWESPQGQGIWMSLVLRPDILPVKASMLTLVMALAVAQGIEKVTGIQTQIKWPNDIVAEGKKLCGILTEMSTEMEYIQRVVIGVGINVNIKEFPEEIAATASSLYLLTGKTWGRAVLIQEVMKSFEKWYNVFMESQDLSGLVQEYEERLVNRGNQVKIIREEADYTGVAKGITPFGELIVERADGSLEYVLSGEVSVRGVYGYV